MSCDSILKDNVDKGIYRNLLDVGCGNYGWNHAKFDFLEGINIKVGIDLNIDRLLTYCNTDWTVFIHNLSEGLPFLNKSFDLVVCLDVLEHLPTETSFKLLNEIIRVGKDVIVYTPEGFFDTEKLQSEAVNSPLDIHKSTWTKITLEHYGFITDRIGPIFVEKIGDNEKLYYGLYGYLLNNV